MEEGGKREFMVREAGVSDPPVPLHNSGPGIYWNLRISVDKNNMFYFCTWKPEREAILP